MLARTNPHHMTSSPSRRRFLRTAAALSVLGTGGQVFVPRTRAASPVAALSPANERIQKSRDVALSVLKPSARDLDRGFKLHAESLVFESYGFAPRAALDGAKFEIGRAHV